MAVKAAHDETRNSITMNVPWEKVFQLASKVEEWPEFLPHYRWVRTLELRDGGRVVEMAARRGAWPVRWVALLEPKPEERRVYFSHLRGPAKGMRVYWALEEANGGTEVTIHHELSLETPIIRSKLGKWIVARGFIHPIATLTLACMKQTAEGGSA